MKYLMLCNRYKSMYGDNWCLWWADNGFSSDVRIARRFTEDEIKKYQNNNDEIPIPINIIDIPEDSETIENYNKNLVVLIKKETLNELIGLNLKLTF